MSHHPITLEELKTRLPLPELLLRLGLFDYVPVVGTYRCPLHEEKHGASFSIFRKDHSWLWKCHGACGIGGDEVALIAREHECSRKEAIRWYSLLAGVQFPEAVALHQRATPSHTPRQHRPGEVAFPKDLSLGSREDLQTVADLRRVDFWAVATMQQNGVLAFGTVCGERCWIVLDQARLCGEARRMNGAAFATGAKVHTLRGSDKSWPVGLLLPRDLTSHFQKFLLVEGSGDLVAAYHWALRFGQDCLPIALLGAGIKRIHPRALNHLHGKNVRIVPQDDPAGLGAVESWQLQLRQAGCTVYIFQITQITLPDGRKGKDLNDTTTLEPEVYGKLEELFYGNNR